MNNKTSTGLTRFKCKTCGWIGYRRNAESVSPHKNCGGKLVLYSRIRNNHIWTKMEDDLLKKHYKKLLYPEIAKVMGFTESQVANRIHKLGIRLPVKELERRKKIRQFVKGQISWNKGLKLPNIPNSGQFKKGSRPKNTLYDGAIVLRKKSRKNGDYLFIRISKMKWLPLHEYLWKKHYGPVPKGMVVRFIDGNHFNCSIKNLELITRKENLLRNNPGPKMDLVYSDRYIAARLKVYGKKNQLEFIGEYPRLIETKRNQLLLRRSIVNATGRKAAANG